MFEPHPPNPYGHDISCPYNNVEKGEKTCFSGGFKSPLQMEKGFRGEVLCHMDKL